MLFPKLVKSDGAIIDKSTLCSFSFTGSVNSDTDIVIGSNCCDCIEFTLWGKNNVLTGDTMQYLRILEDGSESPVGTFIAQKPEKVGENTYKVIAYDMMIRFEAKCETWISATAFPTGEEEYSLAAFAVMLCNAVGVKIGSMEHLLNQNFKVHPFRASGCTYRKVLRWIAEVGGCYAHFNPDGLLEFLWYSDSNLQFTHGATENSIGMRSQTHSNYIVQPIDSVRVLLDDEEIVAGSGTNVYEISDNPLMVSGDADAIQDAAETLLLRLSTVSYTPATVTFKETDVVRCGQIVHVTTRKGEQYSFPIMDLEYSSGSPVKIKATGNERRDSGTAVSTASRRGFTKAEAQRVLLQELVRVRKELEDIIGGVEGGCMVEHKNAFGQVYEVLFIDTLDEKTAMNCLRINNGGIGFSTTGPNGEFTQALAIDGRLSSEWISTWQLTADIITAGVLKSADVVLDENGIYQSGTFFLDLSNGILNMEATNIRIAGKSLKDAVAEAMGDNIDDAIMDAVDRRAEDIASLLTKKQSQEDVFNALTNNGEKQGIYLENGRIYINLEYAKAGTISADMIDVTNLLLYHLFSISGSKDSYVEMLDNGLDFYLGGNRSIGIGYYSSNVPLPYIIFGHGVDIKSDNYGMIKMYENGIWIGDSADREFDQILSGTGMFVNIKDKSVQVYRKGISSTLTDDMYNIAIFG